MKMIVLPFMVSAVIFSLQRLFQEGGTARILGRVAVVFVEGLLQGSGRGPRPSSRSIPSRSGS